MTACFGGLGGVLGMKVFLHKTQHWYFKVFYPVLLIVQIALLAVGAMNYIINWNYGDDIVDYQRVCDYQYSETMSILIGRDDPFDQFQKAPCGCAGFFS